MKACYGFLFIALSCTPLAMSSQESFINRADAVVQEYPDSALKLIRMVDTTKLVSPGLRAKYALSLVRALDRNYIDTTDVSILDPALQYYAKKGTVEEKMWTYYYLGCLQSNSKDYTSAAVSYHKSWNEAEKTDDTRAKGMICASLCMAYSGNHLVEEELAYAQQAYKWFTEYGDDVYIDNALLQLGRACHNNHQASRADSLYSLIRPGSVYYPRILILRATNAIQVINPDYEKALFFFGEARKQGLSFKVDEWYQYALALYQTGDDKSADQIMKSFESVPDNASSVWWKYSIALHQKQKDKALEYLQQYADMSNSYVRNALHQSSYKAEKEQYKLEAEIASRNSEKDQAILVIVSLAALLALSFGAVVHIRTKERLRRRNALLEQQFAESQRMLELVKLNGEKNVQGDNLLALRSSFATMYQKQFSLIGQLYDNNLDRSILFDKGQKSYAEKVRDILSEIGSGTDKQKQFEARIDQDLDGIMSKLRTDFPSLSEESFRMLSYLIVGFAPTTISAIMGMDPGTVRTRKSRLRRQILTAQTPNRVLYQLFLGQTGV